MLAKVKGTIERYKMLDKGDCVLVGVSGGPDSVALLRVLNELKELFSLSLHVVHLNHMFRGREAQEDGEFVYDMCSKMGIPATIETFDVPAFIEDTGLSPEDAARRVRYEVYERVSKRVGANKIALGHNADDQAETVIMRILRGTGLRGIGGIPPVRDGRFIRPLIEVTREEIEDYCWKEGLITRLDSTNVEPIYFRNKVRLELLPFLEERYSPAIKRHLRVLADIARDDDAYLQQVTEQIFEAIVSKEEDESISIFLKDLLELPLALQRRVIKRTLEFLSFSRIEEILELANSGETGGTLYLTKGIKVRKDYGRLVFERGGSKRAATFEDVNLKIPGETHLPDSDLVFYAQVFGREILNDRPLIHEPSAPYALMDLQQIKEPLLIRTRREGDLFHPIGMKGSKKLKDFFIDEKIPRHMRSSIPLIVAGNIVLWIVGIRISELVKVTESTREVTLLEVYNIVI